MTQQTIFVIDDDQAIRESLSILLEVSGFQVKTFDCGQKFLDSYDAHSPGAVILDVRMPGMDGLEVLQILSRKHPSLPVVMLTAHGDVPMAVSALQQDAWHFLEKPYDKERLLEVVQGALDENLTRFEAERHCADVMMLWRELTPRETEVAELLALGRPTKEIAQTLGTSPTTVAHQRSSILHKMGVENTTELARQLSLIEKLK